MVTKLSYKLMKQYRLRLLLNYDLGCSPRSDNTLLIVPTKQQLQLVVCQSAKDPGTAWPADQIPAHMIDHDRTVKG